MQQYPYWQQPQVPYQLYKPVRKRKVMKILAIIAISLGLFLALLSTIPNIGYVFGVWGFVFNVLGLIFLCLI